ncbi:sugar phosphate isomerase/epimerase [Streptomyces sp. YC504]|uniref:Sugar phosphate isomerase/epimerase n=1 Tax=Streptomyces mesophilus TaxID=1775132 RepID=A0A6G4X9A9_9ACTN|nr:sugar phosphate isomerase/epimerase [Streptomyces mesophilus]NGO74126.1 sugar phosphate isomerase/epimerase [Streptomyces mesophilus]
MAAPLTAVQLYSLRDQLTADRKGTLGALASFGYRAVECHDALSDPRALRADLDAAGLVACSAHVPALTDQAQAAFRGARTLGATSVVVPFQPPERFTDTDGVRDLARELNDAAARAADHGLELGYHNHDFELAQHIDGVPALEVLADHLDEAVFLEVDIYWAAVGGQDVPALLRRLGERVTHLHVKDGPVTKDDPMTAVGAGRMPIADILAAQPSVRRHIVELDRCATDMLTAVKESYDWLQDHHNARGPR